MLDKVNRMPKLNSEYRTTLSGSGKGKIWSPLVQLQTPDSVGTAFPLRKINETSYSLKVPSWFLSVGCSSIEIVFRYTQFLKLHPLKIPSACADACEAWNEAVISNATLISKIENNNEQLTVTEPVNFVCVK